MYLEFAPCAQEGCYEGSDNHCGRVGGIGHHRLSDVARGRRGRRSEGSGRNSQAKESTMNRALFASALGLVVGMLCGALLIVSLLATSGCSQSASPPPPEMAGTKEAKQIVAQDVAQRMRDYWRDDIARSTHYVWDERIGGCLLASHCSSISCIYAPVECTDEVKKHLVNPPIPAGR